MIGCTGLITLTGLAVICYLEYVKWRDRKAQDPTTWPETVQLRHFRLPSDGSSGNQFLICISLLTSRMTQPRYYFEHDTRIKWRWLIHFKSSV